MHDVLFIHPNNHVLPDTIPVGAIGAMNLLKDFSRIGRYVDEVTPEEVAAARVVLIDVHWFLALGVLGGIVDPIKKIRPDLPIVVGGISAAFFRRELLRRYPVDYVLTGDVEPVLPELVETLLSGEVPNALPGVWTRGGTPPPDGPRITPEQYDELDWLTLDWFPTFRARSYAVHRRYRSLAERTSPRERFRIASSAWPFLLMSRGCPHRCPYCAGSYQHDVFGPEILLRSPLRLLEDLERIERDPDLHFVNLYFNEVSSLERHAEVLQGRALKLDAVLFFCGSAPKDVLEAIGSGFDGEVIWNIHAPSRCSSRWDPPETSAVSEDIDRTVESLLASPRTSFVLYRSIASRECGRGQAKEQERRIVWPNDDWKVLRPNELELPPDGSKDAQFDRVLESAMCQTRVDLLRALVPELHRALHFQHDLTVSESVLRETGLDPFEIDLVNMLLHQLLKNGIYGLSGLDLIPTLGPSLRRACWAPAGIPVPGSIRATTVMGDPVWLGEAQVDSRSATSLVPDVVVRVEGLPPLKLRDWPRALLPAIPLAGGEPRTVIFGGRGRQGRLLLWVEDRGVRRWYRLDSRILMRDTEREDAFSTTHSQKRGVGSARVSSNAPLPSKGRPVRQTAE